MTSKAAPPREVADLPLPGNLAELSERPLIDALRPALTSAKVHGEVGWVQHRPKANQLVIPVTTPGRVTTVTIDTVRRQARIEQRHTGLADALVVLHKLPGSHLDGIRMNWVKSNGLPLEATRTDLIFE
jgi:hypothetical protein